MSSSNLTPIPIQSAPGIQRDGTHLAGRSYIDGQWVRFQRGLPRKIGGYRQVTPTLPEVVRGMRADMNGSSVFLHMGSASKLTQVVTDQQGLFSNQFDRTPAGFVVDFNNIWMFDTYTETLGGTLQIVGSAVSTLVDIADNTIKPIYFGTLTAGTPLVEAFAGDPLGPGVSGGIVALWPYFMGYGSNGEAKWTAPNDLTAWNNSKFVTGSKIVKGMPLRGNGNGPAVLLWSLTDVIVGQFAGLLDGVVPPTYDFNFTTISSQSSVLSSQGFIDADGIYYWAGVDRFLMFNGVVSDIPNNQNINWFFDNLNFSQRQKVFAYKVPRFHEIWWCFPFGNATECTHAVIFNIKENCWYDTELPADLRTAGAFAQSYRFPFMCGSDVNSVSLGRTLWQHETGVDEITNVPAAVTAIRARIRTEEFTPILSGKDAGFSISRTEPDFVQIGVMQVRVISRANSRAPEVVGATYTFSQPPEANPQDQPVNMKDIGRLVSLEFESNVQGGTFEMGKVLGYVIPQEMRNTGP
jgi:hypothetical protein